MSDTSPAAGESPVEIEPKENKDVSDSSSKNLNQDFDVDPSTGRKVPHKRANEAFLVHQRWLAKQERIKKRKELLSANLPLPPELQGEEEPDFSPMASFAFSMIMAAFVSIFIFLLAGLFIHGDAFWGYRGKWTNWNRYVPRHMLELTPEQLETFDGSNPDLPIFLSIRGTIFDVSDGYLYYGPGGPYHMFAGKDASRAYVTGCFKTHLTHDVRGLTKAERQVLDKWYKFYADHKTYFKVGTLKVPPIDPTTPVPEPCEAAVDQKP